jgi:hypothetical protein
MGYLAQGRCHVTALEASASACAAYPQSVAASGAVVTFSCSGFTATDLALERTSTEGGTPTTLALPVTFAACNEREGYTDGLEAFGLVAGALFLATVMRMAWDRISNPQGT